MRRHFAPIVFGLALTGCGGGRAELDIVEIGPARSPALAAPAGPNSVAMEVEVRAGQLRSVLDRGGAVDLSVFDCGAPASPCATVPVYFGGEPLVGIMGSQLSDDPDTLIGLSVSVPHGALDRPRPCARFVGRSGPFAPEIVSRPVPLPPTQA